MKILKISSIVRMNPIKFQSMLGSLYRVLNSSWKFPLFASRGWGCCTGSPTLHDNFVTDGFNTWYRRIRAHIGMEVRSPWTLTEKFIFLYRCPSLSWIGGAEQSVQCAQPVTQVLPYLEILVNLAINYYKLNFSQRMAGQSVQMAQLLVKVHEGADSVQIVQPLNEWN